MNNKRKNYFKIDRETKSDEILALLSEVNSDLDDLNKILFSLSDNLINDPDIDKKIKQLSKNRLSSFI